MNPSGNTRVRNVLILDRGDYTSCTLNLHGARVTSWRIKNQEMIFVSRYTHITSLSSIIGGIQFVLPVIGPWKFGPKDGFAGALKWTVDQDPVKTKDGNVCAVVSLKDSPYTRSLLNRKFNLYYKITLHENDITFEIQVVNLSRHNPMEFMIMQHALFRVPDVSKCTVVGLKNCFYRDFARKDIYQEESDGVTISGHINRMYYRTPNRVLVKNVSKGGSLSITNLRSRDINLWNPWSEESVSPDNIGENDEYRNFIGIGAGVMSATTKMHPSSCWAAFQKFEFIPTEVSKREIMVKNICDYYNGFC